MNRTDDPELEASIAADYARAEALNAPSITCRNSPGGIHTSECVCSCPPGKCAIG